MLARVQGASDHGQALVSSVLIWALVDPHVSLRAWCER